jgi:hypothetical protein
MERDGYKFYPIDEWSLKKNPTNRIDWFNRGEVKIKNLGKAILPEIKSGKRFLRHNIDSLPKSGMLEFEYEERILKEVTNLGKYIHAINFWDNLEFERYFLYRTSEKELFYEYINKYKDIKILLGYDRFVDITDEVKSNQTVDLTF